MPCSLCTEVDPTSLYLYALDLQLQATQSNCSQFYQSAPTLTDSDLLLAPMDTGSMASTTNCLQYLWNFQSLHGSATTLQVADDTAHHPIGIGYLKVPIIEALGYLTVWTFYTPSLPATILSPTSIALDLHCLGYSSLPILMVKTAV